MFDRDRLRKGGWLALWALLALAWPAAAAPPKIPPGFTLSYNDQNVQALPGVSLPQQQDVKFKKEPAYSGKRVNRGVLRLGRDSKQTLAYALDVAAEKLYVDANGNLDLTDDPPAMNVSRGSGRLDFLSIRVMRKIGDLTVPYRVNFNFENSLVAPTITVGSGWSGVWTIGGVARHVELIDRNMDGQFDGEDGFILDQYLDLYLDNSPVPGAIVLGGAPYEMRFKLAPGKTDPELVCMLAPLAGPLGKLMIEGKSIERIVLGGERQILIDRPGPAIELPAGRYMVAKLNLKLGEKDHATNLAWNPQYPVTGSPAPGSVVIGEGTPATLKMGGPLAATIDAVADGDTVRLNYKLTGNGGESYPLNTLAVNGAAAPPGFEVYQGDRKIAAGKFEFG